MEKITRKDILEKALNNHERYCCHSTYYIPTYYMPGGLCALFTVVIKDITNNQCWDFVHLGRKDKRKIFPKFRRIYAILFFHASISGLWWWDMGSWKEEGRLGFLRWLYDKYKDDTEDISDLIIKPHNENDK